jgi:RimJ/RimL family protein N-acetyltransferase
VELSLDGSRIRSWRREDAEALSRHADNRKIWRNVRDHFPSPYTLADAELWIDRVLTSGGLETQFAIDVGGEAVGGVGVFLQEDVSRRSAEIGYWLGEAHWGRGIMTEVIRRFTAYAFEAYDLLRVYALVFEWNQPSCRVLEKAGYTLEARLRRAVVKDGHVLDQFVYAQVR